MKQGTGNSITANKESELAKRLVSDGKGFLRSPLLTSFNLRRERKS